MWMSFGKLMLNTCRLGLINAHDNIIQLSQYAIRGKKW